MVNAPSLDKPKTVSWKPAKILEILESFKDPRFVYRWADKDKMGNIRKKLSEGWEIDTTLTKKLANLPKTLQDGSNLDSTFQVRELIVMRIPKELAAARNKFYSERGEGALKKEKDKFKDVAGEHGYGKITVIE